MGLSVFCCCFHCRGRTCSLSGHVCVHAWGWVRICVQGNRGGGRVRSCGHWQTELTTTSRAATWSIRLAHVLSMCCILTRQVSLLHCCPIPCQAPGTTKGCKLFSTRHCGQVCDVEGIVGVCSRTTGPGLTSIWTWSTRKARHRC